jgi:hypothetical protein
MIVSYPDSPSGKAFVGKAQPPLPRNKKIGFRGILVQTDDRSLVQCYLCGQWMKRLPMHIKAIHGVDAEEYKRQFSLAKSTALCSDKTYQEYVKTGYNLQKILAKMKKSNNKGFIKVKPKHKDYHLRRKTVDFQNKRGTCSLQLIANLWLYIKRAKKIPQAHTYSQSDTLRKRFGDGCWPTTMKRLGLPYKHYPRVKQGHSLIHWPDETEEMIDWEIFDYEKFYKLMLKKCPNLSKTPEQVLKIINDKSR